MGYNKTVRAIVARFDTASSVFALILAIARHSRTDRSLPEEHAELSVLPPSTAMDRISDLPYNCEV